MSILSLRIPESLHKRVKKLALEDKISINQFIATALAEKISALETNQYLEERANRGDLGKFGKVLSKVTAAKPDPHDSL
jgi:hypothetical protein